MLQVKHVREQHYNMFEEKVNSWLRTNDINIVVKDIKYSCCDVKGQPLYSCIILVECDPNQIEDTDRLTVKQKEEVCLE